MGLNLGRWMRLFWLGMLAGAGFLTSCGSAKKTWLSRANQNTHALLNGYYHADLRYREAIKSAEKAFIPPPEGFMVVIDGTDGADYDKIQSATFSSAAPLSSMPLPSGALGSDASSRGLGGNAGYGTGTGTQPYNTQTQAYGNQNQGFTSGQPGVANSGQFGQSPSAQSAQLPANGVGTIPPQNARRGATSSLFNSDPTAMNAWGPGGSTATNATGLLDECLKKCEYLIYRRPNSNWVDDARLLMAKAAFQKRNYGFALQNLDYVLVKYPYSELVPEVLLWQAKINYQYENNITCRALLTKMLAAKNSDGRVRLEGALLLAQLLTRDGEYNKAIAVLDDNLTLLKTKKDRARVHFLLGQLYEQRGNPAAAREHFLLSAKANYSSLLNFRAQLARLNLELAGTKGAPPSAERIAALRQEIAHMARKGRYADFHDQLEHQLALIALRQKDHGAAEQHFLTALRRNDPKANPDQRVSTYYQLGRLYFYQLAKLDRAQAYFDSAARSVRPDSRDARQIQAYAAALKDYSRYRESAASADSLLALSRLSPAEQNRAIAEALDAEDDRQAAAALAAERRAAAAETAARNQANDANLRGPADPTGLGLGEFYFDSPAVVQRGRGEFDRLWGKRPNIDNWRRSRSLPAMAPIAEAAPDSTPAAASSVAPSMAQRREVARARIPTDSTGRAKLEVKLTDDLYGLAQVFSDQLEMPDSAIRVHKQIIDRVGTTHPTAARSLYALFRILSNSKGASRADAERYGDLLIEHFAESPFARLVRQQRSGQALLIEAGDFESGYTAAFGLYSRGDYATTASLAGFLLTQYADHPDGARLLYLRSMALGHLGQRDSMQAGLEQLLVAYPTSTLASQARETLAALKGGVSGRAKLALRPGEVPAGDNRPAQATLRPDADLTRAFNLQRTPDEKIFALLLVDQAAATPDQLREQFEKFNSANYGSFRLSVSVFTTLDKHLVYVSQFDRFTNGKAYLDAVSVSGLKAYIPKSDERIMLATASNFRIAFTQRRFNDYVKFYRANITEWLKEK